MDKNTFIQLAKDVYQLTLLFPNKEPLRYKIREAADDAVEEFIAKENNYLGDLKLKIEVIDSFFEIAIVQDWTSPAKIKEIKDRYLRVRQELGEVRPDDQVPPEKIFREEKMTDFVLVQEDKKDEIIAPPLQAVAEPLRPLKPMVVPEAIAIPAGIMPEIVAKAKETAEDEEAEEEASEDGEEGEDVALTASQVLRQNRIREFLEQKGGAQVWEIQKIFPNVSKRTIRRDFRSMLKQGLIERTGERNTTAYKLKINIA